MRKQLARISEINNIDYLIFMDELNKFAAKIM